MRRHDPAEHACSMSPLTQDQVRSFADDGFLVVPGLIDADRVAAALAVVDELLTASPPAAGHTGQHCHWDQDAAALLATLCETPAWDAACQLTGADLLSPQNAQVALTYPPYAHRPGGGHLDGFHALTDHGGPFSFTLLAGVILSRQSRDNMGNLFVWPGSHLEIATYERTHGIGAAAEAVMATGTAQPPMVRSGSVQVHASVGDIVFARYLLAHNIGGNTSGIIRKTIYLRLSRPGNREHWREIFADPWHEYDGVRRSITG
jgi:hypothetical protein